ncbi:MAG TPA: ATP cone domain-containing protein [Candidatus Nitrosotalea sp.]|nr:ATP cone domain-containing protein [Candidatus Nitrosotalea sp.]
MAKMRRRFYILKSDGRSVPFNFGKVKATCIRAGASNKLATHVAKKISDKIYPGISTSQIYKMVLEALKIDNQNIVGHRYRLKESIMQMGPAGFPFENYVGTILAAYGFDVKSRRSKIQGACVTHEIDIIAISGNADKYMIECKFHNSSGIYTGIKEALYTHARFLDLKGQFDKEMLVCNTKVSVDAITYGKCVGQEILSWRYPEGKGLEKIVETKGLYPITILGLSKKELQNLSENNIMLAKNLLDLDSDELSKIKIPIHRIRALQHLAKQIIGPPA